MAPKRYLSSKISPSNSSRTGIAFNWDSFSFHPLLGVQVAVSTLVGQAMGAGVPERAVRVAHSGFKVALAYAGFMLLLFLSCTGTLVGVFTPESSGLDYGQVREYAIPMLRLAGLYLLTDALLIIASGALRGAGDTLWCMLIHFLNNVLMTLVIMLCVYILKLKPLQVWLCFVIMGVLSSAMFIVRYKMGRWKSLRIIETGK